MFIYTFELQNNEQSAAISYWDEEHLADAFEKRNDNRAFQPRFPFFVIRRYELNNPVLTEVDVLKVSMETGKIVKVGDDPVLDTFDWEKLGFADPRIPVTKEVQVLKEFGQTINVT